MKKGTDMFFVFNQTQVVHKKSISAQTIAIKSFHTSFICIRSTNVEFCSSWNETKQKSYVDKNNSDQEKKVTLTYLIFLFFNLIPIIKSFLVQNTSTQSVYNFLGGIKIDCTDKKWLPSYIFLRKNGHEKSTWKKALTCFLFLTKHKLFTKSPFRPKPSQSKVFTHLLYV